MLHYRFPAANISVLRVETSIAVVIPVLNEAEAIESTLRCLLDMRRRGCEVLVVDGGSTDSSAQLAEPLCDRVLTLARPGRARQMNAGAASTTSDVLWFLHADTRVPADADMTIREALGRGSRWGRFDVRLSGRQPLLRVVETMMNWRSRWTGIATGDQGLFVDRASWVTVGGFSEIPIMEDIEISRRLRRLGPPVCLRARLTTSSRRWERRGILSTILLMWRLRLYHRMGVSTEKLARIYHDG